jgi:hypothetical protein
MGAPGSQNVASATRKKARVIVQTAPNFNSDPSSGTFLKFLR